MASPLRTQQAAQTRRRIALAAWELFAAQGYTATSMDTIASTAGVAVPTVYKTFGTKRAIAYELNDLIDRTVDLPALARAAVSADSGRGVVHAQVRLGRSLYDRCGGLIVALGAAGVSEADLGDLVSEGTRRHVEQVRGAAGRIAELGELRTDLTVTHAAGLLSQLSSPQTFATLTGEHGWTSQQCEDRLADAAGRVLLLR